MITVAEAEHIILSHTMSFGLDTAGLNDSLGRVLGEDLYTDRDLPPCNRVTMDGIAIRHDDLANGTKTFKIIDTIAAGKAPMDIAAGQCVEIMTGAALPATADTVVRYEDITLKDGFATILIDNIRQGQNIHNRGRDKLQGATVAAAGSIIDATTVSMAASVGRHSLQVSRLPRVAVISTGDELVDITEQPAPWQVRRSNTYTVSGALQRYCIVADMLHLPDDPETMTERLAHMLTAYDVLLLSGGVSMGKYDHLPAVLGRLGVQKLFHKVQQRPGKPFWFGKKNNDKIIFAFPGNPVSTFLCLHRYFLPWLEASLGLNTAQAKYAILDADVNFAPALQYFVQVRLHINMHGQLLATPMEGNGSGDFANLLDTDAFMELPAEESNFKKGKAYRIWPFKRFI